MTDPDAIRFLVPAEPAAIRLLTPAEPAVMRVLVPGQPGPAGGETFTKTAVGVLSGHRVVIASGDFGATYPDLSASGDAELVLGVTEGAAADGAVATVRPAGEMIEGSWSWAPGPVFCGPSGQLVQSPPSGAWIRQIGVAVAPDRLLVQLRPPIFTA